jgi:hypothetical protein
MEVKALRDNIKLLGKTSIEDAERALERSRLPVSDFEFKVSDQTDYSGAFYNTRSTVEVTYKPEDITRSYRAGHQTAFAAEFERDLQNGVFK